jgi:acyl carrier protein
MNNQEIFEKIQTIFRNVFDNPELNIERSTNSSSIEDWDSLNHINLVVAIEKEFKTRFDLKDIQSLKDVGEMTDLVEKKIGK